MLQRYLWIKGWLRSDKGQDLIEYGLLVGFLALFCIVAVSFSGKFFSAVWEGISAALATV
jgi:Flp pilus assembly pilin Flp